MTAPDPLTFAFTAFVDSAIDLMFPAMLAALYERISVTAGAATELDYFGGTA